MVALNSRRMRRALVLFVALAGLLTSGAGWAFGNTSPAEDSAVPFPRPGDQATYQVRLVGDNPAAIGQFQVYWLPSMEIRDGEHVTRSAMRLLQDLDLGQEGRQLRESFYDPATGEGIAHAEYGRTTLDAAECPGRACVRDGQLIVENPDGGEADWRRIHYQERGGPCGFLTTVHGNQLGRVPAFNDDAHCVLPTGQPAGTFQATGPDATGAVTYRAGPVQLSYESGISVPVRFTTWWAGFGIEADAGPWEATLVDYTPGGGIYMATPPSEPGKVRLAPATPWMINDDGMDVPFPLSEAYQHLDQDRHLDEPILVWLAEHPDAYLAHAYSVEYIDGTGARQHYWWLIWTDGVERTAREIIKRPLGPPGPHGEEHIITVTGWNFPGLATRPYPHRDQLPDAFPLVADVRDEYLERADAIPVDYEPTRYLWRVECNDAACSEPTAYVVAGHGRSQNVFPYAPSAAPDVSREEQFLSELWVDHHAAARVLNMFYLDPVGVQEVVVGDADPGIARAPSAGAQANAWAFPSAPAATGLGVFALLLSALYYYWPTLTSAPGLAGFTRLSPEVLLQHPNREMIVGLVEANPGIHFQELARQVPIGRGALDHHMRKLTEGGLLVAKVAAGYTCFFPQGTGRLEMATAGVTKSAGARAIVDALRGGQRLHVRDLATASGLSASTVSHHLSRMRRAGVVEGGGRDGYVLARRVH